MSSRRSEPSNGANEDAGEGEPRETDRNTASYFAAPAWEPVCAVGAHAGDRVNAQICVSVFGATIVEDRPRLIVTLWNTNYTHDLVRESGTLACTLLTESQIHLLEPLGLRSGRDTDAPEGKLGGLDYRLTRAGDPYFPGGAGYVDCSVLDAYDLGDCTAFLVAVRHDERLTRAEPVTWKRASELAGEAFIRRYEEKFQRDSERARATMRWIRE